jgi:hypothetical protein
MPELSPRPAARAAARYLVRVRPTALEFTFSFFPRAQRLRKATPARTTSSALSAPFLTCPPPNLRRTAFCCFRTQALAADLGFYVHDKTSAGPHLVWAGAARRRSNLLPLHPFGWLSSGGK